MAPGNGYIMKSDGSGKFQIVPETVGNTNDPQTLTYNPNTQVLSLSEANQVTLFVEDSDADPINEIQSLSYDNGTNQLSISGGNTVSIPIGSGGNGISEQIYFFGNALIKGVGTGITYARSGNIGTVTIPAGSRLSYIRVNEQASSFAASSFVLKIIDQNGDINQGTSATWMPPITSFYSRDNLGNDPPTNTFPYDNRVDNPPAPQVKITNYGSGQIDITFNNVDSFDQFTAVASF
jgi:hypothetical protein